LAALSSLFVILIVEICFCVVRKLAAIEINGLCRVLIEGLCW
jgi:hypothetical protein